jgi:hypothetical protein
VQPVLLLALVLLIGYVVWPHDASAVFHALQTVVFTLLIWPLGDLMRLDEGTFGCLLDEDAPRVIGLA